MAYFRISRPSESNRRQCVSDQYGQEKAVEDEDQRAQEAIEGHIVVELRGVDGHPFVFVVVDYAVKVAGGSVSHSEVAGEVAAVIIISSGETSIPSRL